MVQLCSVVSLIISKLNPVFPLFGPGRKEMNGRLINVIRNKLTVPVAERVINVMVIGNLDSCHLLLNGIMANEIGRIQKVQNTATRLILKIDRRSSAIAMLNNMHWLSMKKRVCTK